MQMSYTAYKLGFQRAIKTIKKDLNFLEDSFRV